MEKKKLVIFDFDGVLVNTSDLNFSIQKKLNPEITKEYFHSLANGNFLENYYKEVERGNLVDIPDWDEKYLEGLLQLDPHDVIKRLILDFSDKYILAVVSSSTSSPISEFLKQEEVRDCFSEIYGSDVHQSKVVKINNLLEKYSIDKKDVIFITDTLGDIRDGNECEINSIGVTWGNHSRETLLKGKPYEVVDDVLSLEIVVNNFFNSSRAKN